MEVRVTKRGSKIEREITAALYKACSCPRSKCPHTTKRGRVHHLDAPVLPDPTSDEIYMIAYDVLREYEQLKKLKLEREPDAQALVRRFHAIRKEIREKYPNATPPEKYEKLYKKLIAPTKTYAQAQSDILTNLANNGWTVSPSLKIPHATSPNGRLRLWFKPQAVWYTKVKPGERSQFGGTHNFKDARSLSYDLDIRKKDPDAFRDWMVRSSELE